MNMLKRSPAIFLATFFALMVAHQAIAADVSNPPYQAPTASPIVLPSALGTPTMVISDVRLASNTTIGCEIVQRADGATMTVGWLNDVCDKAAADRFANGTTLSILTKLDQSGNSNHCTNATAATQPAYSNLNEQSGIRPTTFPGSPSSATQLGFLRCPSTLNRNAITVYDVEATRYSLDQEVHWELTDAGFTTSYVQLYNPGKGTHGLAVNYGANPQSQLFPRSNVNITSLSLGASGLVLRTNGAEFTSGTVPVSQVGGGIQIGQSVAGTIWNLASDVYAVVAYGATHTSVQMQSVEATLTPSLSVPTAFRNRLVYGGSSLITSKLATLNQNAPWQGSYGRSTIWETYVMAVNGQTLGQEYGNRANYVALRDGSKASNVLAMDANSNDIAAATFTSAADAIQWASDFYGSTNTARATNTTLPFVVAMKAALYDRVVVPTTIARTGWDTTTNWKETARLAYNALVVAGAAANNYVVSDRAANGFFSTPSAVTNTLCYQSDQTHLTNFCYGVLVGIDRAAIGPGG